MYAYHQRFNGGNVNNISATRAMKNAREIRSVAPKVFPEKEPLAGYASVVPLDILQRFHHMTDAELKAYPNLLDAAQQIRKKHNPVGGQPIQPRGLIFSDPPFQGTVYLTKLTFKVGANTLAVPDADVATIRQYLTVASPAISQYCSQYGQNGLKVSTKILTMTVDVPSGKYNDDTMQGWIRQLVQSQVPTAPNNSCVILLNPVGVVNTDGALSDRILGYHNEVIVQVQGPPNGVFLGSPFCFVNVVGNNLTVADRNQDYATALSHEVAEMVVDPFASWTNPEVCDGCAGNCNNEWHSFFALNPGGGLSYLRSDKSIPAVPFDFYIAAVAQPSHSGDCPAPESACAYAPSVASGVGELMFYERADGYGEFYSVDTKADISLQTTHTDWRNTWSLIVPGKYTPKPAGSRLDLLFYAASQNRGEFYQTGNVGDMHQFSVHSNWRSTWSQIVPGSYAAPGSMDLLFYEPSDGYGEFYKTDGKGNITLLATHNNWRTSWSIILSGNFSDSPYDDLLFYDPVNGVGEFYRTDGKGNISLIQNHSNWRKSWSIILKGKFSNSPYDDLLFYDPVSESVGVGEFYRTDGKGNMTLMLNHSNWRKTWSIIRKGKFSTNTFDDLLFYDPTPAAGVGEFYRTDGKGNIALIQNHSNWRKTWSIIDTITGL